MEIFLGKHQYTYPQLNWLSPSTTNKRGMQSLLDHIRRDLRDIGYKGNVILSTLPKHSLIELMANTKYPNNLFGVYANKKLNPTPDSTPTSSSVRTVSAPANNPPFPASGPPARSFNGLHQKSNFPAIHNNISQIFLGKHQYTYPQLSRLSPSAANKLGMQSLLDHIRRDLREIGYKGNVLLSTLPKHSLIELMVNTMYPNNLFGVYTNKKLNPTPTPSPVTPLTAPANNPPFPASGPPTRSFNGLHPNSSNFRIEDFLI